MLLERKSGCANVITSFLAEILRIGDESRIVIAAFHKIL